MLKVKMGVISVKDYDRAKEFYSQQLGFKVVTDAKFGENERWIELEIPNAETKISLFRTSDTEFTPAPLSNIIFSCPNIEEKYQELTKKGVTFTQSPKKESWGTSALFMDSEGNTFCLSSEN